jgi:hypothetical protein
MVGPKPVHESSSLSLYWRLGPHHRGGCVSCTVSAWQLALPSLRWKRNLRLFGISNTTAGGRGPTAGTSVKGLFSHMDARLLKQHAWETWNRTKDVTPATLCAAC